MIKRRIIYIKTPPVTSLLATKALKIPYLSLSFPQAATKQQARNKCSNGETNIQIIITYISKSGFSIMSLSTDSRNHYYFVPLGRILPVNNDKSYRPDHQHNSVMIRNEETNLQTLQPE